MENGMKRKTIRLCIPVHRSLIEAPTIDSDRKGMTNGETIVRICDAIVDACVFFSHIVQMKLLSRSDMLPPCVLSCKAQKESINKSPVLNRAHSCGAS